VLIENINLPGVRVGYSYMLKMYAHYSSGTFNIFMIFPRFGISQTFSNKRVWTPPLFAIIVTLPIEFRIREDAAVNPFWTANIIRLNLFKLFMIQRVEMELHMNYNLNDFA
jgi:hypothetical protein